MKNAAQISAEHSQCANISVFLPKLNLSDLFFLVVPVFFVLVFFVLVFFLERVGLVVVSFGEVLVLRLTGVSVDADGKLMKVQKTLSVQDIFKARQDFLDNVEDGDDYDAKYILTEEGKACLDRLLEEKSVGA